MPDRATQIAAEFDDCLDLGCILSDDEQRDLSVLQVEPRADRYVRRQVAIAGAYAFGGAGDLLRRDDELRAALEPHRGAPARERAGANFRSGQILQDSGMNAELGTKSLVPMR